VLARIEAELARKREFRRSGLGRDQHRSQVAEATSRASVLGGRLAEASGGGGGGGPGPAGRAPPPPEPSARARFLEETLAAMARAWC
jgi:hypothetical protein